MKQSPAPSTRTCAGCSTASPATAGPVARAGVATAVLGLSLAAAFGAVGSSVSVTHSGTSQVSTVHGSGVVVAGGFEWGSNRAR